MLFFLKNKFKNKNDKDIEKEKTNEDFKKEKNKEKTEEKNKEKEYRKLLNRELKIEKTKIMFITYLGFIIFCIYMIYNLLMFSFSENIVLMANVEKFEQSNMLGIVYDIEKYEKTKQTINYKKGYISLKFDNSNGTYVIDTITPKKIKKNQIKVNIEDKGDYYKLIYKNLPKTLRNNNLEDGRYLIQIKHKNDYFEIIMFK